MRITWKEFENHVNTMYNEISKYLRKNKLKINFIAPILRGGAIPATILAYKLKALRIIPVQYKYFYQNKKPILKKILALNFESKAGTPVILVVEGNHSTGTIAQKTVSEIKGKFPKAKIIYAAVAKDYYYKDKVNADFTAVGYYTNENRKLSKRECKKLAISYNKVFIFPWESFQEELAMLNLQKFEYS